MYVYGYGFCPITTGVGRVWVCIGVWVLLYYNRGRQGMGMGMCMGMGMGSALL